MVAGRIMTTLTRQNQCNTPPAKKINSISFKDGLPGLGESRRFELCRVDGSPFFYHLQSLEEREIGFILMDPFPVFPDYSIELDDALQDELKVEKKEDIVVLTTVTITGEKKMTTNLAAPVVINLNQKLGIQLIIPEKMDAMQAPLPLE